MNYGRATDNHTARPTASARCGKLTFDNRTRAKTWAKARKHLKLRVYQCPQCSLWHTTSQSAAVTASYKESGE